MLKRYQSDMSVVGNQEVGEGYFLLTLKAEGQLPTINAGQFVEVRVRGAEGVMLRRPISIHEVDKNDNTIKLLVRRAGEGTKTMGTLTIGDSLNILYPLGNGFDLDKAGERPLLVGGGVGVAPLLQLGKELVARGAKPSFLFGARTASGLLRKADYEAVAEVLVATEDGSEGVKGFVTDHEALQNGLRSFSSVMQCGPTPMMKAVAKRAVEAGVPCFASLENTMACGFGVCLCCVTDTVEGNKRVCADGPVFDVKDLKW